MMDLAAELEIQRLGQRGEGVAQGARGAIYVPYALAGETIRAELDGERAKMVELLVASPDRIAAFCPYYTVCGGCAVQALAPAPYAAWKRDLLVAALRHAGLDANVGPLVDAHGVGRRRATLHARFGHDGSIEVGFMQARTHAIVEIAACPVLAPALQGAVPVARRLAAAVATPGKPLDIHITATAEGLDIDLQGHGPLTEDEAKRLIRAAEAADIARLSNHKRLVVERRAARVAIGAAMLTLPPGAFLQATEAGEDALATRVLAATEDANYIGDLFAGVGTFALRMATHAKVHAVDMDEAPLAALAKAAQTTPGLRGVTVETRDLFRRPLQAAELAPFDAIVFDPPRAGAEQQARAIAASKVPVVVAVSCHVQSFARDAAILQAGGYTIERIDPIDQFRHSAHVEIVGVFRRPEKQRRVRRLLG